MDDVYPGFIDPRDSEWFRQFPSLCPCADAVLFQRSTTSRYGPFWPVRGQPGPAEVLLGVRHPPPLADIMNGINCNDQGLTLSLASTMTMKDRCVATTSNRSPLELGVADYCHE